VRKPIFVLSRAELGTGGLTGQTVENRTSIYLAERNLTLRARAANGGDDFVWVGGPGEASPRLAPTDAP
jgi:hypothetical protein